MKQLFLHWWIVMTAAQLVICALRLPIPVILLTAIWAAFITWFGPSEPVMAWLQ